MSRQIQIRSAVIAVKRDAFGEGSQWLLTNEGVRRFPVKSSKAKALADELAEQAISEAMRED